MKSIVVFVAILCALCAPAYAQEQEAADRVDANDPELIEFCGRLGETSDNIFRARNTGAPLTQALLTFTEPPRGLPISDALWRDVTSLMAREIYALDRFYSEEYQVRQMAEFRAAVELTCLNGTQD